MKGLPYLLLFLLSYVYVVGQNINVNPDSPDTSESDDAEDEEVYELNEFVVTGEEDEGYYSAYSTSMSRISSLVKDTPISMSIINEELMNDLDINSPEDLAFVSASIDNEPNGYSFDGLRIRGFGSPFSRYNFFKRNLPSHGYNISRIDIIKGTNSLIFGEASPGGSVNSVPLRANFRENSKSVGASIGSKDQVQQTINFNQIVHDNVAIRLMGVTREQGYDNPFKEDQMDGLTLAATVNLTPKTQVRVHLETMDADANMPHRAMKDKTEIDDDNNDNNGYQGILSKAVFTDSETDYEVPFSPDWVKYLPDQALDWIIKNTASNANPITSRSDLYDHYSAVNRYNYGVVSGFDKYSRRKGYFNTVDLDHSFSEKFSLSLALNNQFVNSKALSRDAEGSVRVRDGYDSRIFGSYPRPNAETIDSEKYIKTYWTKSDMDTERFGSRLALAFRQKTSDFNNLFILGWDTNFQHKKEKFYDQVPVGAVGAQVGSTQLPDGAYIPRGRVAGNTVTGQFRAFEYISLEEPFTADRSILQFNEIIESDLSEPLTTLNGTPALNSMDAGNFTHLAPYGQAEWALARETDSEIFSNSFWVTKQGRFLNGKLNNLIGVRCDIIDINSSFRKVFLHGYDPGYDDGNNVKSDITYVEFNPSIGALYWLSDGIGVFANYAKSIQPPTGTERTPLGDIAPAEIGEGVEAGIRFDLMEGKLDGQFAAYQIVKENDNEFGYSDSLLRQIYPYAIYGQTHPELYNSSNQLAMSTLPGRRSIGDKTRSEGLEVDFVYNPIRGLSILGSYNYTLANEIDELHPLVDNPDEYELFGRPDHKATLVARYKFYGGIYKGLTVGVAQRYRSKSKQTRFDLQYDDNGDGTIDRTDKVYLEFGDEHTTSVFANYSVKLGKLRNSPKLSLAIRVNNLFDDRGFTGRENYGLYRESRTTSLTAKINF